MSNYLFREKLIKNYDQKLEEQKKRYEYERNLRISKEQDELLKVQKELDNEEKQRIDNKKKIMQKQYNDYLEAIQNKYQKDLEKFNEKKIKYNTSLNIDSEQRLNNYKEKINKLSDITDLNYKYLNEYKEKNRNVAHYNFLSKKYVPDKPVNQTLYNEKEFNLLNQKNDINKNYNDSVYYNVNNNRNVNNIYNKLINNNNSYLDYKKINKQYEEYNKKISEDNLRLKEKLFFERKKSDLERIKENNKLNFIYNQEKFYDYEKKKEYKNDLDKQIIEKIPIKLKNENFLEDEKKNYLLDYQNNNLYKYNPDYYFINKSNFVEVNPYCKKNYNLGESFLDFNTILNPCFNYKYNKYLFKETNNNENKLLKRNISCPHIFNM